MYNQLLLVARDGLQDWTDLVEAITNVMDHPTFNEELRQCRVNHPVVVRDRQGNSTYVDNYSTADADPYAIAQNLEEMLSGVENLGDRLGVGNFSSVFRCHYDVDKAIKIGTGSLGDGDIYSDGYLNYVLYCLKRQREGINNSLLPTIHELYVSPQMDYFIVLLDRYLYTWKEFERTMDIREELGVASVNLLSDKSTLQQRNAIHLGLQLEDDRTWEDDEDNDSGYDDKTYQYAIQLRKDKLFPYVDDLHRDNLMIDCEGNVVITDPSGSNYNMDHCILDKRMRELGLLKPDIEADERAYAMEASRQADKLQRKKNSVEFRINNPRHTHNDYEEIHVSAHGIAEVWDQRASQELRQAALLAA